MRQQFFPLFDIFSLHQFFTHILSSPLSIRLPTKKKKLYASKPTIDLSLKRRVGACRVAADAAAAKRSN